ncbi:MAG: acyl-CoA thioesterase [Desulfuromonadales bacterium]
MPDYRYRLDFQVRDYECDMQGIVNNAVYQHYLEHARHQFLKEVGLDFAAFTREGINLVVIRAELDYRLPLQSGDRFWVGLNVERLTKVRFVFIQDIFRAADDKPVLNARVIGTSLNRRGRPMLPEAIDRLLGDTN